MSTHAATLLPEPARPAASPADAGWHVLRAILASGLFVSACAVALACETALLAGVAFQPPRFYAFLFCATWASYRLHSLVHRPGVPWGRVATTWAVFAVVATVGPTLPLAMWPAVALLVLLSWGYSLPALPGVRRFREFGLAKVAILTGVWTIATTYLPLADRAIAGGELTLLLLRRFLFMFTLCVAFDVRDHLADARAGIRTLPVRLGVGGSYRLMRLTLLAFAALVIFGPAVVRGRATVSAVDVALVASALATWVAVEAARRLGRSTWFYLGFVDGMMLLQAILVWAMLWTSRH